MLFLGKSIDIAVTSTQDKVVDTVNDAVKEVVDNTSNIVNDKIGEVDNNVKDIVEESKKLGINIRKK